jgi:hypothetical protein
VGLGDAIPYRHLYVRCSSLCCAFNSDHEIIGGDYIGIVHFLSIEGDKKESVRQVRGR